MHDQKTPNNLGVLAHTEINTLRYTSRRFGSTEIPQTLQPTSLHCIAQTQALPLEERSLLADLLLLSESPAAAGQGDGEKYTNKMTNL